MICLILAERGFWQCKSLTKSLSRSLNIIWKNRWNLLLTIKFKTHNFFLSFVGLTYCKSVGRKLVSIKFEIVRISVTLTFTVIHFYPVTDLFTLHSIYVYAILRWKCRKKSPDFRRIEQPEASLRRTSTYIRKYFYKQFNWLQLFVKQKLTRHTHTHTHTSWRGEAACCWLLADIPPEVATYVAHNNNSTGVINANKCTCADVCVNNEVQSNETFCCCDAHEAQWDCGNQIYLYLFATADWQFIKVLAANEICCLFCRRTPLNDGKQRAKFYSLTTSAHRSTFII